MEENKNNAIEKVENIAKENNSVVSEKQREQKAESDRLEKQGKEAVIENQKAIREQARQAKQVERDRRLLERKNKKEEQEKLRLQRREERIKKREQIRLESKSEKAQRLANEKREYLQLKRQLLEEKQAKKLDRKEKSNKKKERGGIGGWLAAVISLGAVTLILTSLLLLTIFTPIDDYLAGNVSSQRSFYDLVECVNNIDVDLSKLIVSNDSEEQQRLLSDTRVHAVIGAENLATLPLSDESKFYTTKFINQVGDFSKVLNEKLIEGGSITSQDKDTLYNVYEINKNLKNQLNELASKIDEKFNFKSLHEGNQDNIVISKFNELENNALTYPSLIYDGAFSDGVKVGEAKLLKGESIVSKEQAKENLKKYFASYNLKNVELIGESVGDGIETYNFEAFTQDEVRLDASISKKGGKLIIFNHYKDCSENNYSVSECKKVAEKFLENLGITNMKAVWYEDTGYTCTFNFASTVNGVICYSDLIKVNVCKERGQVSGIESKSYYNNHCKRELQSAKISLEDAKSKVTSEIEVETSRLCIIPYKMGTEKLCYEFSGKRNDDFYYIYVDAVTGKEVNIFKVVETTEGSLLI